MTAFVPDYDYDVFISYARSGNHSGWVSEFKDEPMNGLSQALGKVARIFFDTQNIGGAAMPTRLFRNRSSRHNELVERAQHSTAVDSLGFSVT